MPLDYLAQTPPSVSPDGLIVAGRRGLGPAVRDAGEPQRTVVWTRDDVTPLSTSTQAGADTAYTVARDGDEGQALLIFDPANGHTINSYPLPEATGFPVGVSIGHDHPGRPHAWRRPGSPVSRIINPLL